MSPPGPSTYMRRHDGMTSNGGAGSSSSSGKRPLGGAGSPPGISGAGGGAGPGAGAPNLLPEEMRALQKEKEREREMAIDAEMSRQSSSSSMRTSTTASSKVRVQRDQLSSLPACMADFDTAHTHMQSPYSSNHMESSVTRLLVATKMLLESLTKWSIGQKTETQVSDVYVRLGNDFITARQAFGSYNIDMR